MKVLIISPTNNPLNGYGNITHELASFLATKVDLTVLLPINEPRLKNLKYKVDYCLPNYISTAKNLQMLSYLSYSYKADVNIIHSLFEFPYDFLAARVALQNKSKLVVGAQGTFAVTPSLKWPEKYLVKWVYDHANAIVVPSVFTMEKLVQITRTKTPVTVIHNGVNFDRFQKKIPPNKQYKDKLVFLTVGGLKNRKGQDLVIKALSKVRGKLPPFTYLIVGKGSWEDYLSRLAKDLKIADKVIFLGEKNGNELVSIYKSADIYIHTPRMVNWNFEGFGIVYLEASACHKPIISTDSGGIRDAVIANKTGLIVPENDENGLEEAILTLANNHHLRKSLGENGQKYAKAHDW